MPGLGVSVALFDQDSVLLTRRADMPVWCLPSGGVGDGETIAEAAVRETLEETGVEARLVSLIGIYSRPNWWNGGTHGVLFKAVPAGGVLIQATDETVDARYFSVDELPNDLLWWHAQRIADAYSGQTGVVMMQDSRPPMDGGRTSLARAIELGELSVERFLADVAGPPRADLQRVEVDPN